MTLEAPHAGMAETLEEMGEEFDLLGDPSDPERYRHVIDLGKALAPLTDAERDDANKVRGCASQVWLVTERISDRLVFRGDSDAHIVRGLVAILLRLYSGRTAQEILAFDPRAAFARLGLAGALSGFFGIGGGFLIVPGLMAATRMPILFAVGSSLVAVTAFGLTTALNYARSGLVDWPLAVVFIGGGVAGGLCGAWLATRLSRSQGTLNLVSAAMIGATALYMLYRSLGALGVI